MNYKKSLVWFYMLIKRLLFKVSFVLLILSIPVLVYAVNISMQGDSGVLKIILCANEGNTGGEEIIKNITSKKSIMLFSEETDKDTALKLLSQKKADAVWFFADDFNEAVSLYASGKTSKPFVTVYEREDTLPLKLSREKLFGEVYNKFSYYVYKDFIYEEIADKTEVSEDVLKKYYDGTVKRDNIVEIKNTDGQDAEGDVNYLLSPLRGMLAVLVVICAFAGAMYFLNDKKDGKYDWLPGNRCIIPAFAQCGAAALVSALAVFGAIVISGIGQCVLHEIICMLLFVLASAGFCLCFAVAFKKPSLLGAFIPVFVILMMVLSPIFFNITVLKPIRLMLPVHYYLYAVYDSEYLINFVFYIVLVYSFALLMNKIVNK